MRQRPMRYLLAVLCAFAVGAAGSCHTPPAAETRSYYMARNSASDAAALGCYNGDKSGRMSLFFGSPTTVGGSYGATAWGAPDLRLADIENVVKNVIRGYAYCRANGGYRLQIGVGTSNSTINSRTGAWLKAHGYAWATSVRALAAWANANYPGVAQVFGAWDPKAGAAGSVSDVVADPRLNHRPAVTSGVRAEECGRLLKDFFAARRR